MNFFTVIKKMIAITMLCCGFSVAYANDLTPVGKWKTIDDESKLPRSIVQIWDEHGQLKGKIEKIFLRPGEQFNELCDKCPDAWHNQKKVGMTILWGFMQNPKNLLQWTNGKILDPKTGKIYQCQLTLAETGNELKVRGYVGMPLLGRTQQWLRVKE